MQPVLWAKLATVLAAAGGSVLVGLAVGAVLVPWFRRRQFVSREAKEGVAQGRTDVVPMGGGFILLVAVTVMIAALAVGDQIRLGYAACFLIAFWGFGLLGYLDDRSKAAARGYSDKVKVVLQVSVTAAFAISFYWYYNAKVDPWSLRYLTVPFVDKLPLRMLLIPFVMLFLFWVSNAVNITDGFNGLAGGLGAICAVAYAVVTFLIGAASLGSGWDQSWIRMFALSHMSAIIAGALVAYLYFNWCRGAIYFGDTGSMALGAALSFLAVFSRTEFLLCVIGGIFFVEAASVFVQKVSVILSRRVVDPLASGSEEPFRPLILAPLHHHFEHLLMREREGDPRDSSLVRAEVRRLITRRAWFFGWAFAAIGVLAEYGHFRQWIGLYNWACVTGVVGMVAILAWSVATRFRYDTYFLAPDRATGETLTLYRGIPWRLGQRPLFSAYETTDIPVARLGELERRTALLHPFYTRVDARLTLGLVYWQAARREPARRRDYLARAVAVWDQIPENRFLTARRRELLAHKADALAELGHFAAAVEAWETLYRWTSDPVYLARLETVQNEALAAAAAAYSRWTETGAEEARAEALPVHRELLAMLRARAERARQVFERLETTATGARAAIERQLSVLEAALTLTAERCERLQPAAEEVA